MADKLPPPPLPGHLPSSFDTDEEFYTEKPMQKVIRKIKEEPLVPLGMGLTVFAFVNAYRAIRRGDSRQANKMFRARVAAQGFTVIAMVAGSMYYSQDRQKTKELRKLKEERDAEEKRQRWIRELEARDEEDKLMRATLEERRRQRTADSAATTAAPTEKGGEEAEEAAPGTRGILGKMGLWSQGQEKAEKEAAEEAAAGRAGGGERIEKKKRDNPKSSLGAIGEVFTKEKEDGSRK
ncbi:Respiratory supercomplex factor 1, mitochondrial [Claviceps maximensis]|nr:Respiratory supercomplex factor 1, mitochondrial [Claviceps maximensis]